MSMGKTTTRTTTPARPKPHSHIHVQHSTSPNWAPGATCTLASAFGSDPATAYMLNHLSPPTRLSALQKLFTLSSNAAVMAGGGLWSASTEGAAEVPNFQAAATIFPPSLSLDNLTFTSLPSLLWSGSLLPALLQIGFLRVIAKMNTYAAAIMPAKKSTFPGGENYFYIHLIGTSSAYRGKGLAPALIKRLQERAQQQGKPIWLEASNESARRVYAKLGFEDVGGVIRLGRGECDAEGERAEGKEAVGVAMWPMIWRPKDYFRDVEA